MALRGGAVPDAKSVGTGLAAPNVQTAGGRTFRGRVYVFRHIVFCVVLR